MTATKLFFLSLGGEKPDPAHPHGAVLSCNTDGSDLQTVVSNLDAHPDGLQYDAQTGHIYYTNMGVYPDQNDGYLSRVNVDGTGFARVVGEGVAGFTPKQCTLEAASRVLYWCDREGMRIWRARLPAATTASNNSNDKLEAEMLYQAAEGDEARKDQTNHCVGITVDAERQRIYWTQKGPSKGGVGRLFTAGLDVPSGETPDKRSDVVCLLSHLPEPIDLELDHQNNVLYKTDRGAEPRGNTVSKVNLAGLGSDNGISDSVRAAAQNGTLQDSILASHLHEAIGLALDLSTGKMYFTDIGGSVYSSKLDGSDKKEICSRVGDLTGITVVHL